MMSAMSDGAAPAGMSVGREVQSLHRPTRSTEAQLLEERAALLAALLAANW